MSSTLYSEIKEIKKYHNNGELKEHYFEQNDHLHGEYKWYYHDGTLDVHAVYEKGERHGEYKTYYEGGELHEHCFYNNGERHGEFKMFSDAGKLFKHCFYKDDGPEEELSEYVEDINNTTDDEFMNLSMVFGNNFFATTPPTETAS